MFIAQKHACLLHRSMHPILSGTDLVLPSWQVFEWKTYINGVFPGSWAPFTVMVLMHANQQSTVACVAKVDSFTVVSRSIWNNTLRSARARTHTHTHTHTFIAQKHASITQWTEPVLPVVTFQYIKIREGTGGGCQVCEWKKYGVCFPEVELLLQ